MFKYEILHDGAAIGRLTADREGLYWRITARCRAEGNTVLRLYAIDGGNTYRLCIPVPEGEDLCLRTGIAASAFSFSPQTVIATSERVTTGWTPWSGQLLGVAVTDALRRGNTIAIPHRAGETFPLMAHFRRFYLGQIGEGVYWMTDLEEPAADREKTVDNGTEYDKIATVL